MSFRIRKVEKKDKNAIIGIIEQTENLSDREKECARELFDIYLNDPGQTDYYFYASVSEDNVPLGYICYGMDAIANGVCDIYWILVAPGLMGRGVGRSLVSHIEMMLKELKARMMVVETSSLSSYKRARNFYERCGFHGAAVIKDFFKPGDDKIIYVKNL